MPALYGKSALSTRENVKSARGKLDNIKGNFQYTYPSGLFDNTLFTQPLRDLFPTKNDGSDGSYDVDKEEQLLKRAKQLMKVLAKRITKEEEEWRMSVHRWLNTYGEAALEACKLMASEGQGCPKDYSEKARRAQYNWNKIFGTCSNLEVCNLQAIINKVAQDNPDKGVQAVNQQKLLKSLKKELTKDVSFWTRASWMIGSWWHAVVKFFSSGDLNEDSYVGVGDATNWIQHDNQRRKNNFQERTSGPSNVSSDRTKQSRSDLETPPPSPKTGPKP